MNLPDDLTILRYTLEGLTAERDRLNALIAEGERRLGRPQSAPQQMAMPVVSGMTRNDIPDITVSAPVMAASANGQAKKRNISPEARKRIQEAQKRRWAKVKKAMSKG